MDLCLLSSTYISFVSILLHFLSYYHHLYVGQQTSVKPLYITVPTMCAQLQTMQGPILKFYAYNNSNNKHFNTDKCRY